MRARASDDFSEIKATQASLFPLRFFKPLKRLLQQAFIIMNKSSFFWNIIKRKSALFLVDFCIQTDSDEPLKVVLLYCGMLVHLITTSHHLFQLALQRLVKRGYLQQLKLIYINEED